MYEYALQWGLLNSLVLRVKLPAQPIFNNHYIDRFSYLSSCHILQKDPNMNSNSESNGISRKYKF